MKFSAKMSPKGEGVRSSEVREVKRAHKERKRVQPERMRPVSPPSTMPSIRGATYSYIQVEEISPTCRHAKKPVLTRESKSM